MACGEWELRIAGLAFVPGYWSEGRLVAGMAALVRGHDSWMSLTPFEYESQEIGIRFAHGHVLIFGLGMGWAAAACAALPAVRSVTVVEKDPEVIALNASLDPFAQLPDAARAKLRLIEADAFDYVPDRPVDLLTSAACRRAKSPLRSISGDRKWSSRDAPSPPDGPSTRSGSRRRSPKPACR
jgi:hypothetical protein